MGDDGEKKGGSGSWAGALLGTELAGGDNLDVNLGRGCQLMSCPPAQADGVLAASHQRNNQRACATLNLIGIVSESALS